MAEQKTNQANQPKEMSDNEQALIRFAIAAEYNQEFKKDTPKKLTVSQIKNNHIVEILSVKGKSELMGQVQELQKFKANPLASYTKKELEILKPHFSLEGIELDLDTKKAKLVAPYEAWYAVEFPNSKKRNPTPANTSISAFTDFLFYKGIESIPNLYKMGVINSAKTNIKDIDGNVVKSLEELVSKVA
jgi:hypothetical protein